jgi:DNA polymerase elongation subunit (family B)
MLKQIHLFDVLFLDIETVPAELDFDSLPPHFKEFWEKKSSSFRKENESAADVYHQAGLHAEFGKIICISVGIINRIKKENFFRVKSFFGDDEKKLLSDFSDMLRNYLNRKEILLCAHNGKNFDFPFIARRMLINGIELPDILDTAGKKPWDSRFIDTMDLWKFGEYRHAVSLDLLAELFGIETPKEEMNGSMVAAVYWEEKNLRKIVRYCEQDVLCVAQLILKFKGLESIPDENIQSITE